MDIATELGVDAPDEVDPTRFDTAFQYPYRDVGDEPVWVSLRSADDYTSGVVRVEAQALDLGPVVQGDLAAGWVPVNYDEPAGTRQVVAEKDGLLVRAYPGGRGASLFEVRRAAPAWLALAVLAGGLIAAAAT